MIRKVILIMLYLVIQISLSAQKGPIIKFWNRYQAGIEAGPSLTSIWGSNYQNHKADINYTAHAFFRYNFLQWMAIQSGVQIERIGTITEIVWTDMAGNKIGDGYLKTQYDYVTLPIIFKFDATNKKCNLNFSVGGFISYMINARNVLSPLPPGTPNDPNPGKESIYDISDSFKKYNAGIIAGIGLDYQFMFGLKIGCEVRDQLGLVHISNTTTQHTPLHTNSLQFLGRISFRF